MARPGRAVSGVGWWVSRWGGLRCQAVGVNRRRVVRRRPSRSVRTRTMFRLAVAPVRWRLPKPRTRQAWAVWADDDWNLRQDAVREQIWRSQTEWADAHREELRAWSAASDAAKA